MKKEITKTKICISLDIEIHRKLELLCEKTDSKVSTKINGILRKNKHLLEYK